MPSSPGIRQSLHILSCLGSEGALGFADISRRLQSPSPTTVSRLLKVLQEEDWVETAEHGYSLGPEAKRFIDHGRLQAGADDPHLMRRLAIDRLARTTGESAAWVLWENHKVRIEHKVEMPESFHYLSVGSCQESPSNGFVALGLTMTGATQHPAALLELKRTGIYRHHDRGLRFIAPVQRDGELLGFVGITTCMSHVDDEQAGHYGAAVTEAAVRIQTSYDSHDGSD